MNINDFNSLTPDLVLGAGDHRQLNMLALAGLDRMPDLSDDLLNELERARVVADAEVPADIVRMGTTAVYRTDSGQEQRVTLVYPVDADIAQGRISILTPIGTALIGLRVGQSITWRSRDGKRHMLTLLSAEQPAAA